jgi:hypothetical protein
MLHIPAVGAELCGPHPVGVPRKCTFEPAPGEAPYLHQTKHNETKVKHMKHNETKMKQK